MKVLTSPPAAELFGIVVKEQIERRRETRTESEPVLSNRE